MDTDYVLKNPSIAEEREECIRRSVDAPIIPFFIDDVHTDIRKESVHILESTLLLTSHIDQFISMIYGVKVACFPHVLTIHVLNAIDIDIIATSSIRDLRCSS